ncbi:MAG TPA: PEGA domain-containing protein [Steroidobacteraceae bacterium]|nr:PEGA domain-containing protein [Steroidobacteraceae bacterium]
MTHASSYAQVRVREPAGERILGDRPTLGGLGADVVVPGAGTGAAIQFERQDGTWVALSAGDSRVQIDGVPLRGARDLRRQDVLRVGDAQIIVSEVSRTLLRIEVCHLAGNATLPPSGIVSSLADVEGGDEEVEIRTAAPAPGGTTPRRLAPAEARRRRLYAAVALISSLAVLGLISRIVPVALDVEPDDARLRVPGTLLAFHLGGRLFLFPGAYLVRAEHQGYEPAQVAITVRHAGQTALRLHLIKLPGTLQIDTGGIASTVSIDGLESGRAPGDVLVPAGEHTIAIRAPRYVDYIAPVRIEGALTRQNLKITLQPSWGTLQISTIPSGAQISVDGNEAGKAPAVVDAPSGVRRVRISAPGLKTWESSLVLKAGEALNVGPITLGQADAHLVLHSDPSGADVMIGGTYRGRTPLESDLPAGIEHEVTLSLRGYATWTKPVFAESGRRIAMTVPLAVVGGRVAVEGEPDGAQLLIDGIDRGRTPQSLVLSAVEHHIEVHKEGRTPFALNLTPAPGLDRTIRYKLGYVEHALAPDEVARTLYSQTGYLLRLVVAANFAVSGEQTVARRVSGALPPLLSDRPFYVGVAEVTNEQFRRFRPDHVSGSDQRSPGSADQPVTQVSWNEAAAFCNWLSEQDNLPPAYARSEGRYVLRRPVSIGYRLPMQAEWEYAARNAATLGLHDLPGRLSEWVNDDREGAAVAVDAGRAARGFRIVRYAQ